MDGPFDNDAMDEIDAAETDIDSPEAFDASETDDSPGSLGDGFDEAGDAWMAEGGEGFGEGADDMAVWDAFEEEIADGLDAASEDEFLGRLLGGLGRAAGVAGRGLGGAAQVAQRARGLAGRSSSAATAAARLARMLGAGGVASGLDQIGRGARTAQGMAGRLGRAAGGAQGLFAQISQLMGGGNEFDDFDAMAELYAEEGVDEALPAAVALAARAAARGLGLPNVSQLGQAGRRALVRGVAAAARELVRRQGPRAVQALPRLAHSAARVAARSAGTPQRAAQAVRRGLPRTAQRVAQSPRTLRRLAQPAGGRRPVAPLARPTQLGRGLPSQRLAGPRTFEIDGPVTLTVKPR
ncbi:hypothetical protein [Ramlibacter sp. 2FC]|uniref:hypothetical protein n=1 Tax=Ramlibacter sp. 2FC TaxID=2502188 RepID=UPI0010F4DB69|nr:hypothetical protein [Ramlibacter sp. 2FC]